MKTKIMILLAAVAFITNACYAQVQDRIELPKTWRFSTDPTDIGLKNGWQKPDFDASGWRNIDVPGVWENQGINQPNPNYQSLGTPKGYDGYAWYRLSMVIPSDWKNKTVYLNLGKIDDHDWTYFNGSLIGQMSTRNDAVLFVRSYQVPAEMIKYGESNLIAVRVLDFGGWGGIIEGPVTITTGSPETATNSASSSQTEVQDRVQVTGNVTVGPGETVGDAVAVMGNVTVKGHVTGEATAVMGNIVVENGGVVDGNATTVCGQVIQKNGGKIKGQTTSVGGWKGISGIPWGWAGFGWIFGLWGDLAYALVMAVLAALVVALFPARMETVAGTLLEQPGRSALFGIVSGLLIVPVTMLLILTIIGIPLVPLEILLIIIAFIVGQICAGLAVGNRIISAINKPPLPSVLAAAIGMLVLGIVKMMPFIGGLLVFAMYVLAFGAVIITGFGTHKNWFGNRFHKHGPPPAQTPMPSSEPANNTETPCD
ncbi:hypothetical protein LLG46_02810 [bacterium]|nr:hypothetical protein [bacterium]